MANIPNTLSSAIKWSKLHTYAHWINIATIPGYSLAPSRVFFSPKPMTCILMVQSEIIFYLLRIPLKPRWAAEAFWEIKMKLECCALQDGNTLPTRLQWIKQEYWVKVIESQWYLICELLRLLCLVENQDLLEMPECMMDGGLSGTGS